MEALEKIDLCPTPEIAGLLRRYLEIQRQDNELQAEKSALQKRISDFLSGQPNGMWFPVIDGIPLKVRFVKENIIEYDEEKIRERLGERYSIVASPDPQKIRSHLAEIEPLLAPLIAKIGSTNRHKVRNAVEKGILSAQDFAGTYRKETRTRLAVMKDRPMDGFSQK